MPSATLNSYPVVSGGSLGDLRSAGILRAAELLGTTAAMLSETSTDFNGSVNPFTNVSGGGGSAPAAVAGVPSGAFDCVTGVTSGGYSGLYLVGGTAPSITTVGGFYTRSYARVTTAASSTMQASLAGGQGSANLLFGLGILGSSFTGGNDTKFTLFGSAGATYVAGVQSSVNADTSFHLFELWCPVGGGTLYGSVDGEAPFSVSTTGMSGSASFGPLIKTGAAASLTMRVDFVQACGVRA